MVASSAATAIAFTISPGQNHDAPEGRHLLKEMHKPFEIKGVPLGMDRAYEDNETRELAASLNFVPIVPPKKNRLEPWDYDKELYKRLTKSNDFFAGSKLIAAYLPGMTNSTSSLWVSFYWLLS